MTQQQTNRQPNLVEEEARASIFGFPLVLMDLTREVSTAVPKVDNAAHKAPINQIAHLREFPDSTFTDVVSPNADTLYSLAFLDLKSDAVILSVPDMGERYYLMELLDAWTNVFACPGTRTTGNRKRSFAIVGPTWTGKLPTGVDVIESPTNLVWLIGRTQTNGKKDYAAVHALQDQYKITPLSAWGQRYEPPVVPVPPGIDVATSPVEQIEKMGAVQYYARLNALMQDNPPSRADADAMKRFAKIGISPGRGFGPDTVDPAIVSAADQGSRTGLAQIVAEAKKPHGTMINGWEFMTNVGRYGTDYLWRAAVALLGLGANLPEDAIYPRAVKDADGRPLTGASRYEIKFPRGGLPPVRAFWSITLYNEKQAFAANAIDRYAIGDRDALALADDGSLTLYVQNESPGSDKESNWLPAPNGSFNLLMRLYWPSPEIIEGKWTPPPVLRIA